MRGNLPCFAGITYSLAAPLGGRGPRPKDHQAPRGIRAETAASQAQRARCVGSVGLRWGHEAGRPGPFLGKTATLRGFDPAAKGAAR
jgi:hypothetical protein